MGDRSTPHTGVIQTQDKGRETSGAVHVRRHAPHHESSPTRASVIETEIVIVDGDGTEEPLDRAALLG